MSSVAKIQDARAIEVEVRTDELVVHLDDGRTIATPLAWYPRLLHATEVEREHFRIVGRGIGIHWPDLDEDVSVAGMLADLPPSEGQESLRKWIETRKA